MTANGLRMTGDEGVRKAPPVRAIHNSTRTLGVTYSWAGNTPTVNPEGILDDL